MIEDCSGSLANVGLRRVMPRGSCEGPVRMASVLTMIFPISWPRLLGRSCETKVFGRYARDARMVTSTRSTGCNIADQEIM